MNRDGGEQSYTVLNSLHNIISTAIAMMKIQKKNVSNTKNVHKSSVEIREIFLCICEHRKKIRCTKKQENAKE